MKRRDLIRHLEAHDCYLEREGANHSMYLNPANGRIAPVHRHCEIWPTMVKAICEALGIPRPRNIREEEAVYGNEYD